MKHCYTFNNLDGFAAAIELHDSDVQRITLDKTGLVLWLDGIFFPENSPVNELAPCFAYGCPARILFSDGKLCPAPEHNEFFSLIEKKDNYFEIITNTYGPGHVLLEGRFYTEKEFDFEASLEIHAPGSILVEWEDVCKEG